MDKKEQELLDSVVTASRWVLEETSHIKNHPAILQLRNTISELDKYSLTTKGNN